MKIGAAHLREDFQGAADKRGLVAPAAVRFGCEVGCVGLDQHSIAGDDACRLSHYARILEGQDSREGDEKSELQKCRGGTSVSGEAVDYTPRCRQSFFALQATIRKTREAFSAIAEANP